MQGCCPHRESPSSPRKIAAGILETKSLVCAFDIGTRLSLKLFVGDRHCFAQNSIEQGRRACCYLRLTGIGRHVAFSGSSFGESPSPLKYTGLCGAIHTAAFRASEAGSEAPIRESDNYRGRTLLIKCRSEKLTEQVAKSRRTSSLGSEPCRIPQPRARASMKSSSSRRHMFGFPETMF
jgi:hypothetical protein